MRGAGGGGKSRISQKDKMDELPDPLVAGVHEIWQSANYTATAFGVNGRSAAGMEETTLAIVRGPWAVVGVFKAHGNYEKAEIARAETMIKSKQSVRSGAEALFKK